MKSTLLCVLSTFHLLVWSSNAQYRRLEHTCHLGVRVFDDEDGSNSFECFCELHGDDRNPNKKGPHRITITSTIDGKNHCEGMFLNLAASNEYEVFLEAMIKDETNELDVEGWDPIVSLPVHKKRNHKSKRMSDDKANRDRGSDTSREYNGSGTTGRFMRGSDERSLQQSTTIAWSLLVVRVGGIDYAAPSTDAQLADDWFQDSASLATQIAECSANKMTFSPRVGQGVTNGVMTVMLKQKLSGLPVRDVEDLVLEELANRDIVLDSDSLEKIVLCLPESSFLNDRVYGGHAGYAVPNGNLAAFKGEYCNRISTQMHEIGHTLGLQHSGDLVDNTDPLPGEHKIGDRTGAMGGWHSPDDAEMCYNAAKTWQLGWRPTKDIIPGNDEATSLTLTSFADWDGMETTICIARIVTADKFYFIHYNRQVGSNADTQEYGDKVVVTSRSSLDGIQNILSQVVAVLDVDDNAFALEDVGSSGFDLLIVVNSIALSTAHISVRFRGHTSAPFLSPTLPPSDAPSFLSGIENGASSGPGTQMMDLSSQFPSISPSGTPSSVPSSIPSFFPTYSTSPPASTSPITQAPPVPPTRTPPLVPSSISPSALPSKVLSEQPRADLPTKSTKLPSHSSSPSGTPSYRQALSPPSAFSSTAPSFFPTYYTPPPTTTFPTQSPTKSPSSDPSTSPSVRPSKVPSKQPSTDSPSKPPTNPPTKRPTDRPTGRPTNKPSKPPTKPPTRKPTKSSTSNPTRRPTKRRTARPTNNPSKPPIEPPTKRPTKSPTRHPTYAPVVPPTDAPVAPLTNVPDVPSTSLPTDVPIVPPTEAPVVPFIDAPAVPPTRLQTDAAVVPPPTDAPTVPPSDGPVIVPCGCGPAKGQNQPECNNNAEQRCKRMIQNEGKCCWKVCVKEEPLCGTCQTASGQNQPECNNISEQRCKQMIQNEGKCFWNGYPRGGNNTRRHVKPARREERFEGGAARGRFPFLRR